jgi:hypothetical protein
VEATTRLEVGLVTELNEKASTIRRLKPELVKPCHIKAVHTLVPLNDAVEEAKRHDVWVLAWKEELSPLDPHNQHFKPSIISYPAL